MDAELAKELELATSDLLDLTSIRGSTPNPIPEPSTPFRQPLFSPDSKLEPIHSPSDVKPPFFSHPTVGMGSSSGAAIKVVSHVEDDDRLPSAGLSSRVGSVRAGQTNVIAIAQNDHLEEDEEEDERPLQSPAKEQPIEPSPSKLRIRTPVNDVYLNEYGERVVNGKVVAQMRGGRKREHEKHHAESVPSADSLPNHKTGSEHNGLQISGLVATTSTLFIHDRQADLVRAQTPPEFFLQSFPDALETGRRTPSHAASPARAMESFNKDRKSLLKAPRPLARALDFGGGSDDLDSIDGDEPDDHFDTSRADQDDQSFHTAGGSGTPARRSPPLSAISTNVRRLSPTDLLSPDGALSGGSSSCNSDQPLSPGATSISKGSRLGLPFPARRPTPTTEISAAQTEPLTLHGNKRQARQSRAQSDLQDAVISNASTRSMVDQGGIGPKSFSQRIETLFKTPLVDASSVDEEQLDDGDGERPWEVSCGIGRSASMPSSPTFSAKGKDDEDDKASLDSLPASLLSLPVSTLTSSSHATGGGGSNLERRRSGGSTERRRSRRIEVGTGDSVRFARDVQIRGWKEVGGQARGWVVYEIRIVSKHGTIINILRRFSSFVQLRRCLMQECKDQAKWMPVLPSKRAGLLHKYEAQYLEKRRKMLQKWLEIVMLDRWWGSSTALREWVLEGE